MEVISNQKATFSNVSIQGIGADTKLVGSIFATSPGKVSAPIIGKDAVYIIEVISIDEAKSDQDFSNKRLQMQKQSASYTNVSSYNVLKEAADIVDNRVDFF